MLTVAKFFLCLEIEQIKIPACGFYSFIIDATNHPDDTG